MKKLLLGVIGLYLVAMGYLYFTQNDQLFPAKLIEKEAKVTGENIEPLSLHVNENVILDGVLRKDEASDAGLILYFGGNADDATESSDYCYYHYFGNIDGIARYCNRYDPFICRIVCRWWCRLYGFVTRYFRSFD